MLSVNDYNHLKLLYDLFLKSNTHIKNLINEERLEDVDVAIQEKENILRQIIFFEKPRLKDIKDNPELHKLRTHLIELEKENIELMKTLREKFVKDLSNVKKTRKVLNAYEPALNEASSTIDIKEED